MNKTKKLVIVSGANSELAQPFMDYFSQQTKTKIIAIFKNREIKDTKSIVPLQCDLMDDVHIKNKLIDVLLSSKDLNLDKMYFLHMIGSFKYEWLNQTPEVDLNWDWIDDDIYDSNIKTFDNVFAWIYDFFKEIKKDIPLSLFNVGSKRDYDPTIVPWKSYSMVKNILRKKFQELSQKYKNINSLFVNAATIDISKERKLRPFGEYEYRLSINDIFEKSIHELENVEWYKELEIYKYHPKYETNFKNESLQDTHDRWMKEMWK